MISLTVLGAPQWHNQRNDNLLISEWQKHANKYKNNGGSFPAKSKLLYCYRKGFFCIK